MDFKAESERNKIKDFSPVDTLGYRGTNMRAIHDKALHDAGVYNILNAGMYDNIPNFLGYMTLAELSQDGVIKAGVDLRADEMTRRWIEFMYKGESGDDLINQLEDDIDRLHVKKIFREAIKMCGYYGGCLVYIDTGNISREDLKLPLGTDTDTIRPNSIEGLKIIEPFYVAPCRYNCSNPIDKDYYVPQSWLVNGVEIHASRFLYFAEDKPPSLLAPSYNFFGVPLAQTVLDAVLGFEETSKAAARMLTKCSCLVMKTDMNEVLSGGSGNNIQKRIAYFAVNRDNDGAMVIDKDSEDIVIEQQGLGGVTDIVRQQMDIVAAMFSEPAVKLWGLTPSGLNATGDIDMRSHYDHINAVQERIMRDPLEYFVNLLQLNRGLEPDSNLSFDFVSLSDEDEKLQAEIQKLKVDSMAELFDRGIISGEECRHVIANDPESGFDDIDESAEPIDPASLEYEPIEGAENGDTVTTS